MKSARHQNSIASAQDSRKSIVPIVSGQCARVLSIIRQHGPVLSLTLTADYAIPETAARVHDLRCAGWNIQTNIHAEVVFRGQVRKRVAAYSLGVPEWPRPGFAAKEPPGSGQLDLGEAS